ncbi:MAG TPA: nitrite reductase small subunit NirD [Candidatus Acidoferrum sp.]|nr:nitrite reductase small subunit NirD [Candidatus Acidoferrum sp.]
MNEGKWIRITSLQNIPLREGRAVCVSGREIAIFNLGDRLLAVDGRCPHKGGPLAEGIVTGDSVVCPLHAWKISLQTGNVTKPEGQPGCVATFRTRIESGVVLVEVPEPAVESQGNSFFCAEQNQAASGSSPSPSPAS